SSWARNPKFQIPNSNEPPTPNSQPVPPWRPPGGDWKGDSLWDLGLGSWDFPTGPGLEDLFVGRHESFPVSTYRLARSSSQAPKRRVIRRRLIRLMITWAAAGATSDSVHIARPPSPRPIAPATNGQGRKFGLSGQWMTPKTIVAT